MCGNLAEGFRSRRAPATRGSAPVVRAGCAEGSLPASPELAADHARDGGSGGDRSARCAADLGNAQAAPVWPGEHGMVARPVPSTMTDILHRSVRIDPKRTAGIVLPFRTPRPQPAVADGFHGRSDPGSRAGRHRVIARRGSGVTSSQRCEIAGPVSPALTRHEADVSVANDARVKTACHRRGSSRDWSRLIYTSSAACCSGLQNS